jgi:hypothetical protein
MNKGLARVYAVVFCFIVFGLAFAINRPAKYPTATYHNVYIWNETRGKPESWGIWSLDITSKSHWMVWNCCPDYPCHENVRVGWIADTVSFEERGYCKSIRAQEFGFFYQENGPGRRIDTEESNGRPTARQMVSSQEDRRSN